MKVAGPAFVVKITFTAEDGRGLERSGLTNRPVLPCGAYTPGQLDLDALLLRHHFFGCSVERKPITTTPSVTVGSIRCEAR